MNAHTSRILRPACRAMALGVLLTWAAPATGQSTAFTLYGTVRDFTESHQDFGLPDSAAANHVAGNIAILPALDGDPVLTTGGFVVNTEWYERLGNEIAPHMFEFVGSTKIDLVNPPTMTNNPTIDTYDPTLGPYNKTTAGPMPNVVSGATMPTLPAPPDLGASIGDVNFNANGNTVIDTSFRCNNFTMRNRHQVMIDGNVVIVVDGFFNIEQYCEFHLSPTGALTLYLMGDAAIANHVHMAHSTGDYTRMTIYYAGTAPFPLENNTHIYATLLAPNAELVIGNNADFYGAVTALGLSMTNSGGLHIAGPGGSATCANVQDTPGAAGGGHSGNVTNSITYDQWYNTVPGTNADAIIPMTFNKTVDGLFEYTRSDFTPIDFRLYGNEGQPHNRNLTLELTAKFNNSSCEGKFFEFTGGGDVWVFINEKLVIDLAGPQTSGHQYIDIDRLGLVDGKTYRIRFFYAQRTHTIHPFEIRTNLDLINDLDGLAPAMAMFD